MCDVTDTTEDHGLQNAQAWLGSIREMVAALECNYERLEELKEERADLVSACKDAPLGGEAEQALAEWNEANSEELTELIEAAGECENQEQARDRIEESALSVQVRSGWYSPGDSENAAPEEFEILLTTGGPALRIIGELNEHREPVHPRLQYQDWGTPWAELIGNPGYSLYTFVEQFYFGE